MLTENLPLAIRVDVIDMDRRLKQKFFAVFSCRLVHIIGGGYQELNIQETQTPSQWSPVPMPPQNLVAEALVTKNIQKY
jgi:hypothetical protein